MIGCTAIILSGLCFKDEKYRVCPLLETMIEDGKLGVKSKEGFYKY